MTPSEIEALMSEARSYAGSHYQSEAHEHGCSIIARLLRALEALRGEAPVCYSCGVSGLLGMRTESEEGRVVLLCPACRHTMLEKSGWGD